MVIGYGILVPLLTFTIPINELFANETIVCLSQNIDFFITKILIFFRSL
jgi:hypothetical protein